eukprot:6276005-Amphidinium_carterae.1
MTSLRFDMVVDPISIQQGVVLLLQHDDIGTWCWKHKNIAGVHTAHFSPKGHLQQDSFGCRRPQPATSSNVYPS